MKYLYLQFQWTFTKEVSRTILRFHALIVAKEEYWRLFIKMKRVEHNQCNVHTKQEKKVLKLLRAVFWMTGCKYQRNARNRRVAAKIKIKHLRILYYLDLILDQFGSKSRLYSKEDLKDIRTIIINGRSYPKVWVQSNKENNEVSKN